MTIAAPQLDRVAGDLAELSNLVEPDTPGWTRRVFSDAYRAERDWIAARMTAAGLDVHVDGAGNVVGVRPGRDPGLPPIVTGSHTDTVIGGGRYDGIVGVLGAIEAARLLRERDVELDHDLVVVDFLGEEANRFGTSCVGSGAFAGLLATRHLDRADPQGARLGDAMDRFGVDPSAAVGAGLPGGRIHASVELHVEQGPDLERQGVPIGVVTAITGIERVVARFAGRADHAGTMPMDDRRDALAAAAAAVLAIERVACDGPPGAVATVGRLESGPGQTNVVPDAATLWAECRSVDATWLGGVRGDLTRRIVDEAQRRQVDVDLDWLTDAPPVPTTAAVRDVIAAAADDAGLPWSAMPSGAGHDTGCLAELGPVGMIFVPSAGGRSHCPEEHTDLDDIGRGIAVLAGTLARLDHTLVS